MKIHFVQNLHKLRMMGKHTTTNFIPVSYTHLDVYKRQVYSIGISETGDCMSYIRFTGKGCKETGRITDCFRGDRDGTICV